MVDRKVESLLEAYRKREREIAKQMKKSGGKLDPNLAIMGGPGTEEDKRKQLRNKFGFSDSEADEEEEDGAEEEQVAY